MNYFFGIIAILVSSLTFAQTDPINIKINNGGAKPAQKTPTSSKAVHKTPAKAGGAKTTTPPATTTNNHGRGGTTGTTGSTGGDGGVGKVITGAGGNATEGDASQAIKEALTKGISAAVNIVAVENGYYGNPAIKIPLPAEIQPVDDALRMVGMGSMMDKLTLQLNQAAEQSAKQALPIFANSITQMSVTDAVSIVSNAQPDAATQFLKRTTTTALISAFKPQVKTVLDKTYTSTLWGEIMGEYNKLPFVSPVNTDLPDYVTRKALDGLFYMMAQEEGKIRKNPAGAASDIISKVFGKYVKR